MLPWVAVTRTERMDASDPIPVERDDVRRGPPQRLGAVRPSRSFLSSVKHLLDAYGLRAGAALVAGAALGGAVYRVPTLERVGHRYLNEPGMSVESADLDPVRYFASTGAVVAARNAIPPDDTYTIALGPDRAALDSGCHPDVAPSAQIHAEAPRCAMGDRVCPRPRHGRGQVLEGDLSLVDGRAARRWRVDADRTRARRVQRRDPRRRLRAAPRARARALPAERMAAARPRLRARMGAARVRAHVPADRRGRSRNRDGGRRRDPDRGGLRVRRPPDARRRRSSRPAGAGARSPC